MGLDSNNRIRLLIMINMRFFNHSQWGLTCKRGRKLNTCSKNNHCFLAAMSSSRSDVVTHSVRSFVTKEFFLSLKSFNGVSGQFKGYFKEVLWCPVEKEVSGKFQGCSKED